MGVQITPLFDNRYVIGPRTHRFVESGLGGVPLPPFHEAPRAGRWIGSEEDRIESLFAPCLRWTAQLHQLLAALEPGRVVEDLDQALLLIESQPGDHFDPRRPCAPTHPADREGRGRGVTRRRRPR